MTTIVNRPDQNHDPRNGKMHDLFSGKVGESVSTPTGAVWPWKDAPIGSMHLYQGAGLAHVYVKAKDNNANNDWAVPIGVISQTVSYSDFTDGGAALGTLALTPTIPAGATVLGCHVTDVTGFTGDVSAALTVGIAGGDVDRYNTGTPSVFTTATWIDMGVPSGTVTHTAAATVTLHVTTNADFTSVAAGALTVRIFYFI